MTAGKVCSKCHKWAAIEGYAIALDRGKPRVRPECRECQRERYRRRYHERKAEPGYMERRRVDAREVYQRTRDKRRAVSDAWYQRNKARVAANRKRRQMRKAGLVP